MSKGQTNLGRNAVIEAFVNGRNIQIANLVVGSGDEPFAESDTDLQTELASYGTDNSVRGTGRARFDATIPENDASVDDETLREVGLEGADGELYARIVHADTPKSAGSRLEYEVTKRQTNP